MRTIRQFTALVGLTATETLRQPLCLLLTTTGCILTALVPMVSLHSFGEEGKLARDSGLALHFVIGLFVAVVAACSALSREVRSGTAGAVLSKPVGRGLFFLGKYAGIGLVILSFSACMTLSTLISERVAERFVALSDVVGYVTDWRTGIWQLAAVPAAYLAAGILNYRRRRPFQSAALGLLFAALAFVLVLSGAFDRLGRWSPYALQVDARIVPASLLVTLALLVLAAVALALSTRLSRAPTLALSAGVFLLGLLSDYAIGRFAGAWLPARALYAVIPNWQHFWMSDALMNGGVIPGTYVAAASLYALTYSAAVLGIGWLAFRSADLR